MNNCTSTVPAGTVVVAASATSPVIGTHRTTSAKLRRSTVTSAITVMGAVVVTLHGAHAASPYATSV